MKVNLTDIIINSATAALDLQRENGSFEPGSNGPWSNKDTPVRATAHWAVTFCYAYKLTKDQKFKEAALKAGEFLLSPRCRPHGYSFYCRQTKSKGNGLIGQAWVVQSLVELYETFGKDEFIKVAEDVLVKHQFNGKLGLWKVLSIDGKSRWVKRTINQHLLFCAMVAKVASLTNNELLEKRKTVALQKLHENIEFNGKHILHGIHNKFGNKHLKKAFRKTSRLGVPFVLSKSSKVAREYLSYTLFGLASLKTIEPKLEFWGSAEQMIRKTAKFVELKMYGQKTNPKNFSWSYNPTGFEVALAIETFGLNSTISKEDWVKSQIERHFDFDTNLMNKNTVDPNTLASRIYQATYLSNLKLNL